MSKAEASIIEMIAVEHSALTALDNQMAQTPSSRGPGRTEPPIGGDEDDMVERRSRLTELLGHYAPSSNRDALIQMAYLACRAPEVEQHASDLAKPPRLGEIGRLTSVLQSYFEQSLGDAEEIRTLVASFAWGGVPVDSATLPGPSHSEHPLLTRLDADLHLARAELSRLETQDTCQETAEIVRLRDRIQDLESAVAAVPPKSAAELIITMAALQRECLSRGGNISERGTMNVRMLAANAAHYLAAVKAS